MSSSDDSETAEWEREQMMRGQQSRARHHYQGPQKFTTATSSREPAIQNQDVIDATKAKDYVKHDIKRTEIDIENTKKKIGTTRLDISRSMKRIDDMRKQIEKLEAANPFFEKLQTLKDPRDVLDLINQNRQLIFGLPPDQKEMINLLAGRMKDSQVSMSVDD